MTDSHNDQPQRSKPGVLHFFDGLKYGSRGLRAAFAHAEAFRQELVVFGVAVVVAVLLGDTAFERAILIGVLFPVLIAELVNTAIETVVDRISTEDHELSGRAKDLGAAAVLLSIIGAATVWLLVLLG